MSEELQEIENGNSDWYKNLLLPDVKQFIKSNMESASRSFVEIGYYLKYIRDNQLYKEDEYTGISEFAKAEFGISPAQASKFMSINDRFSVDGNSPVLLDQYKDFGSSKLSEMLYLTDEQLEQVKLTTTKAEIRQIGKPTKEGIDTGSFSPAKTEAEPEPYWKQNTIPMPERDEYIEQLALYFLKSFYNWFEADTFNRVLHVEHSEKELKKKFTQPSNTWHVRMPDGELYHFNLFHDIIQVYSQSEHLGYIEWFYLCAAIQRKYTTCTMDRLKAEIVERKADPTKPVAIDDLDFSVNTYNCLKRAGIDTINELCELTEDEVIRIRNISRKCLDEIKLKLTEIGRDLKPDDTPDTVNDEPEIVDNEPEIVNDVDEADECSSCKLNVNADYGILECHPEKGEHKCWSGDEEDPVEIVEADIIQTEPEETFTDQCEAGGLKFNNWLKTNNFSIAQIVSDVLCKIPLASDNDPFLSSKVTNGLISSLLIKTDAYYSYLTKELNIKTEKPKQTQPELPILRNNDQRKEFIEAYETWPVWINQELTGERYYRYDFDNEDSVVVKVYYCKIFDYKSVNLVYEERFRDDWGKEEYYLLEPDKYFKDCETNKSSLVDYLKEFQKKGC